MTAYIRSCFRTSNHRSRTTKTVLFAIPLAICLSGLLVVSTYSSAAKKPPDNTGAGIFATDNGDVQCAQFEGHTDCLGIPYAAPPVGDLRFRAPAAAETWDGVRDATRLASACLQAKTEYAESQQGSEDCLYLNVYIPTNTITQAPLPVIVWLHGGGFVNGSGNAFNGAYLAQTANAIIVTVNYRLGPFGWLALPSLAAEAQDGSTGNYGLLDSIAALKWVQRNIGGMGGDPQRVTISGQSAGGEQVFALVASPYAAGLFQRAISMSSPASLSMPTVEKAAAKRAGLLAELGCTDTATQPACLRSVPAQRLLDASHISWDLIQLLGLQWTPTVDGAVLPDQWLNLFRQGKFNKVPIMVGHTKEEARLFVAISENVQGGPMTTTRVEERSRSFFGIASRAVFLKYPERDFATPGDGMAQVIVDSLFATGLNNNRDVLSQYVPVYGYQFCDPNAAESHVHALYSKVGCAHDSDLPYLFQWDDFTGKKPAHTPEQQALAFQMGRYWGNFAASGDPNGPNLPNWPKFVAGGDQVQLLEPASVGNIRSSTPGAYSREHKLGFWNLLAMLKSPKKWVPWAAVTIAIVIFAGWFWKRRWSAVASR